MHHRPPTGAATARKPSPKRWPGLDPLPLYCLSLVVCAATSGLAAYVLCALDFFYGVLNLAIFLAGFVRAIVSLFLRPRPRTTLWIMAVALLLWLALVAMDIIGTLALQGTNSACDNGRCDALQVWLYVLLVLSFTCGMMEGVGCVLALMAMGREKRGWVKPGLDGAGASTDIGVSRRVVR